MEAKIALIAPDAKLARVANKVVRSLEKEIKVLQGSLREGLRLAQKSVREGCEIIISRGRTGEMISQNLDVPVINIEVQGYDIIYSISSAAQISSHIGIVGFSELIHSYEKLISLMEKTFSVHIRTLIIDDSTHFNEKLIEMFESGTGVFIGGHYVNKCAADLSFPCILIETGEETIADTILRATEMLDIRLKEKKNTELLRSIIDFAYDGIMAVDEAGLITVFNPVIQKLTGTLAQDAIGRPVNEVVENSRMDYVRRTGVPELGEIQHIGTASIVTNRVPIVIDNKVLGVVATFQEVEKFQKAERSIRKKLLSKGYVARNTFESIIGESEKISLAKQKAKQYAAVDSTVLILGESGTGKELFAQSIHNASSRADKPFVAINCASLPESLLESELFGYVDGAFTGAKKGGKPGLFELAHRGTIFLDEIGEMLPLLQVRILRVLQEKEVMRLGDDSIIPVDIRIIAASNKDLFQLVKNGDFRDDLFYRLCVLRLDIPPLRERGHDISAIVDYVLKKKCKQMGKNPIEIAQDVRRKLEIYDWPGNVRELENIIERCIAVCEGDLIDMKLASDCLTGIWAFADSQEGTACESAEANGKPPGVLKSIEREMICKVLRETGGNKTATAARLGMSKTTLWRRLRELGIE